MRVFVAGATGAIAAGARRVIAQRIAFVYAPGPEPHRESDPLLAEGGSATMVRVHALERLVVTHARFDGLVLRYGRLYGEGTWASTAPEPPSVSVGAAARAAVLAVSRGSAGLYNVVDDGGPVANIKSRRELGWVPDEVGTQP